MKKLGPGCNEEGWKSEKGEVKCVGDTEVFEKHYGCGAPLEVTKADLYTVSEHRGMSGRCTSVRFTCPCGVESNMPDSQFFTNLPDKKDWEAKQAAAQQ